MCSEHGHIGAVVGADAPTLIQPPKLITAGDGSAGLITATVSENIGDILGNMGRTGSKKINKGSKEAISEDTGVQKLGKNDLGAELLKQLNLKIGGDLDKALDLYTQVSSFGIDKAVKELTELIGDKKLHPDTVGNAVFGKTTTAAIVSVNDMIQESRDERQGQKTYAVKTPAFIAERVFPILARMGIAGFQDNYRMATLEANIGGAISQIEVLSKNKGEMDLVVQGVKEAGEGIKANQQELYKQYASMVYIAAVLKFHLAAKRSALSTEDLDQITNQERETEIRGLERQLVDVQSMANFIEARAIVETHNAERADITAQNIENEYLMSMYALAQKIQNYMQQEGIIKGVNLGLALQELKGEAMKSFFEDQQALNNLQTQLEESGLNFLVDLSGQIQGLAGNIARNNDTLSQISDRQQSMLSRIEADIVGLREVAVPHLVDMRADSDDEG